LGSAKEIINNLRSKFNKSRVNIKFQDPKMSVIEGTLARGDRRINDLIYDVYLRGERFSSWDEVFNYDLWMECIDKLGIDIDKYNHFYSSIETLPWDFIDTGVDKRYVVGEAKKAKERQITENCIYSKCSGCGVCKNNISNLLARDYSISDVNKNKKSNNLKCNKMADKNHGKQTYKFIFQFQKKGLYRFISHLDLLNLFIRIGKRIGIPFKYSEGYNPRPKIILPFPLPLGIESEYEIGELFLEKIINEDSFLKLYNGTIDSNLRIDRFKIVKENRSFASRPFYHDYLIFLKEDLYDKILFIIDDSIDAKPNIDDEPKNYYNYNIKENFLFIRLEGGKSIKNVFKFNDEKYSDFLIKRIKIWKFNDNKLCDFF